jgi:acetyltransferase-like isoleucine patch superfamily enzyme
LGAGAVTSNVKSDKTPVVVRGIGQTYETNRKKCGAMLGDYAEIGCNSVLNPGTVIGRNTSVYPLTSLRGVYPENCIVKSQNNIIKRT